MELKELELLKKENLNLQKEIRVISIKSELNDWKNNENNSSTLDIGLCLDVTLYDIHEDGLTFNVECSNNRFEYTGDEIEIGFCEIDNWFKENGKPVNQSNLDDCLMELIQFNVLVN
jgi:hypothetical protein